MRYINQPNLLMESLSYMGRHATGNTWEYMEERIRQRGIQPSQIVCDALDELKTLAAHLDKLKLTEDPEIMELFRNMDGLRYLRIQ